MCLSEHIAADILYDSDTGNRITKEWVHKMETAKRAFAPGVICIHIGNADLASEIQHV